MNRKRTLAAMAIALALLLCGCGSGSLRVKNADGTKTEISYHGSSGFARLPVFEKQEGYLTMSFNGIVWYTAEVIDAETREALNSESCIAESSNVTVYLTSEEEYPYRYVIDLGGTDAAYILIRSNDGPEIHCYGNDFGYCIEYSVNGTATVPDTDWTMR